MLLHQLTADPHPCAYLPDRLATMEYSWAAALDPQEYENLMNSGYRKFGRLLFRPVCAACQECQPLRTAVDLFQPDRSQRRAFKRNQDLTVQIRQVQADSLRLDLYNRYHEAQAESKGWRERGIDEEEYTFRFVDNPVPGLELSLWEGSRLLAVVLAEVTPHVVSAIYHFHDPDEASRSLGTCSLLHLFDLARKIKREWVYFGYYVAGCASMSYKARFQPCEILGSDGAWRRL